MIIKIAPKMFLRMGNPKNHY